MSNASDFFIAGVQNGDYLSTERTTGLIEANGQDIFGFGFEKLELIMSLSDKIESFGYVSNSAAFRAFTIQAHGRLGWRGSDDSHDIEEIDFNSGEVTTVDTGGAALSGFYDACCNDVGDRIFFLGANIGNSDLFVIVSEDGGATWTDIAIFTSGFAGLATPINNKEEQLAYIQCDLTGNNLRVVMTTSSTNLTIVFESDDVGQTWSEILTPRELLTSSSATGNCAVSRDLSTTLISSNTEFYVSTGGTGTLTDIASNYPGVLSANTKMVASDDGSNIAAWTGDNTDLITNKVIFHTSSDGGVSWLTHNVDLNIPSNRPDNVKMGSAYFDPDNADLLFFVIGTAAASGGGTSAVVDVNEGEIYSYNISSFELIKVGNLAIGNVSVNTNLVHIQSDFKANGSGFTYGIGDSNTIDKNYSVDISTGMLLLDTSTDTQPLKISSGKQTNGEGTLGFSWDKLVSPTDVDMRSLYVSSDKVIIVISGATGLIVNSKDSGATFVDRTGAAGFGGSSSVFKIDGANDNSLIIASSQGEVRRSLDDGDTWSASTGLSDTGSSSLDNYHALSCITDGTTVIAGSRNDNLDVSTNSGSSFTLLATPFTTEGSSNTNIRSAIIAKGDDQIIFVGNEEGVILRSLNGGSTFALPSTPPVGSPDESKVFDLACSSDGSIVFAALSDKLFLSTDTGDTWVEVAAGFTKVSYRRLSISDDGTKLFATDNNGVLIRSLDSGVTFFKTLVPWEETRRRSATELSPDGALAYACTDDALIYRTV